MSDELESRRRRAAYRALHRGTKEMDIAIGRFAESALPGMEGDALGLFERFLTLPDPDLQDMIWDPQANPAGEFAGIIAQVRAFHGLEDVR